MKEVKLICNYCGNSLKQIENEQLPKDWFALGYHKGSFCYDDWRVTHHFCTEACMNEAIKVTSRASEFLTSEE